MAFWLTKSCFVLIVYHTRSRDVFPYNSFYSLQLVRQQKTKLSFLSTQIDCISYLHLKRSCKQLPSIWMHVATLWSSQVNIIKHSNKLSENKVICFYGHHIQIDCFYWHIPKYIASMVRFREQTWYAHLDLFRGFICLLVILSYLDFFRGFMYLCCSMLLLGKILYWNDLYVYIF